MCCGLGPRRGPVGRPSISKNYPEYWMNEKRILTEDGVLSADGKRLVKASSLKGGTYVVPVSVERILVGAFEDTSFKKIVFHPGVKSEITTSMFRNNIFVEEIQFPSGKISGYNHYFGMFVDLSEVKRK